MKMHGKLKQNCDFQGQKHYESYKTGKIESPRCLISY